MLHEALRLLRVLHDLKSVDMAAELGISPSYLSEIEAGKKEPSLEIIRRYARVFKTTSASLLFFAEELDKGRRFRNVKAFTRKTAIRFLQRIEDAGASDLSNRS